MLSHAPGRELLMPQSERWPHEWNQARGVCVWSRMNLRAAFCLSTIAGLVLASPGWCQDSEVKQQTRAFLDAWARGDKEAVMSVVDRQNVTVYGGDASEVAHGAEELARMLALDQRLWGGAARIGAMEHVTVSESDSLASIFFDAPFSVGDRAPVTVRFAATWKREGEKWLLVQSSNVVPTMHQSAGELLQPAQVH
jgi:hypothetical protein